MAILSASSSAQLDRHLHEAGDKLVVIMFSSDDCGACRLIAPKVTQLSRDMGAELRIVKVNIKDSGELIHRYHISLLPTFLFLRNGKNLDKFSGADAGKLDKKIKSLLKKK